MDWLFLLGLMITLLLIFLQDLKRREIHIMLPISIFLISTRLVFENEEKWRIIAGNIVFFMVTFLITVVYMSLKSKKILNPFQHYFGLGDLLFYISITPLFYLYNYVVFFISSLIFTIVIQVVFKSFVKEKIPLAGLASIMLVVIFFIDFFCKSFNFLLV